MSRIAALAAGLAVPLVLAGCGGDDSDDAAAAPVTVAVGGVLEAFPGTEPSATTEPPPTTPPAPATTEPEPTEPPTTPAPVRTTFATDLVDLVGGPPLAIEPVLTTAVADDSGRLSLDVPLDWVERDTTTGRLDDGTAAPHVAVSPDMRRFLDGYDAAGLTIVVLPGADDLDEALDAYSFDDDCTPSGEQSYVGEEMVGEYRVWRDCGGTGTDIVTVVLGAGQETVLVLAQVRDHPDLAALDTALATLTVRPA